MKGSSGKECIDENLSCVRVDASGKSFIPTPGVGSSLGRCGKSALSLVVSDGPSGIRGDGAPSYACVPCFGDVGNSVEGEKSSVGGYDMSDVSSCLSGP